MTVLRREDVQSMVASWDMPYRTLGAPILTIVPLIIRRLRGLSPTRVMVRHSPIRHDVHVASSARGRRCGLERRPQKSGQLSRDRYRDLRRGLVVLRQASEPSTQPLLRLVGNRNDTAWLSFPPPRQRDADAWAMLIVPCRFNQQPADQRVPRARDAAPPMLLTGRVLARHEAEIRHQRARRRE